MVCAVHSSEMHLQGWQFGHDLLRHAKLLDWGALDLFESIPIHSKAVSTTTIVVISGIAVHQTISP